MEKFSYETNGYNRSEVNQFISDVITQTQDIVLRCQKQRDEIIDLKKQLEHYQNIEDTLKIAVIRAQKVSEDIKRMANEESESIIRQAKDNASIIVNEALIIMYSLIGVILTVPLSSFMLSRGMSKKELKNESRKSDHN